jgi:hypothetical protein
MISATRLRTKYGYINAIRVKYANATPLDQNKCNEIAIEVMDYIRTSHMEMQMGMQMGMTNDPIVVIVEPEPMGIAFNYTPLRVDSEPEDIKPNIKTLLL